MLWQLISHFDDGNKARFAKRLGVRPQTINTWESRETFDIELIYSKCEGVSGDWLLSGEGKMMRASRIIDPLSESEKKLVGLCKMLVEIVEHKESVMGKLVETVKQMD